jgi:hypothetical protein
VFPFLRFPCLGSDDLGGALRNASSDARAPPLRLISAACLPHHCAIVHDSDGTRRPASEALTVI